MPMPLDSWLTKVRSAMSSAAAKQAPPKKSSVGILAFEVASLMSKLLRLWRAVGDAAIARLHRETINLAGVRKVVSDDDDFLLGLACAELVDALRDAADSIAALAARCADPGLRDFRDAFLEFADTGRDRHRWAATTGWKEMDARARKMEKQLASTTALRRAMEDLAEAEHGLRKLLLQPPPSHHRRSLSASKISVAADQQQLIFSRKQEVKQLKQTSIWGCTFDAVVASLARAAFTILARIKLVFVAAQAQAHAHSQEEQQQRHPPLYRSLTLSSAVVHPSSVPPVVRGAAAAVARKSMSVDMMEGLFLFDDHHQANANAKRGGSGSGSFFENSSVTPPPGTLGADALAPRYAGLVVSIERMARSPRLVVGPDERDELYGMLTASVRAQLRSRLRGAVPGADPWLANQWRAAMAGILEWLAPMAHATMRWQAERSLEQRNTDAATANNVLLLLQTLHFADRGKVEAAVAELLVGLNYVWRFEKEMMSCRALFAVHRRQLMSNGVVEDTAAAEEAIMPPMEQ